ncbi:MAG TPA: arylesterase [Gemmatimonadales bacterium]|jgi:acyl-CoA thioesterase-1
MAPKILVIGLLSFTLACDGQAAKQTLADTTAAPRDVTPVVLFLGTSLTAGLGLDETEAYPAQIQRRVDSAGLHFRVANAGVSGETSAGGLRRLDWLLNQPVAVLVLELGANDALRGQDLSATRQNLQDIVTRTRARHPDATIVVAGMQAPPNLGRDYTTRFKDLFPDLARQNRTALIPFLLDSVAAIPALNQRDGIHPNSDGEAIVTRNVWRVLEPILKARKP